MRAAIRFRLASPALALGLVLLPALASAQTEEPAAGNPAIIQTPTPSTGAGARPNMASPSNEDNIPKGSNPEGGSGNRGAGSGATPPSSAREQPTPSQTGNNPQSSINESRPSQTATNPNADMSSGEHGTSSGAAGINPESMPQGKYASPPDLEPGPQH